MKYVSLLKELVQTMVTWTLVGLVVAAIALSFKAHVIFGIVFLSGTLVVYAVSGALGAGILAGIAKHFTRKDVEVV